MDIFCLTGLWVSDLQITMIILSFNWNTVFLSSHYFLKLDNKSLPMRFQFMPINLLSDVKRRSKSLSTIFIQFMIKITTAPYLKLFTFLLPLCQVSLTHSDYPSLLSTFSRLSNCWTCLKCIPLRRTSSRHLILTSESSVIDHTGNIDTFASFPICSAGSFSTL